MKPAKGTQSDPIASTTAGDQRGSQETPSSASCDDQASCSPNRQRCLHRRDATGFEMKGWSTVSVLLRSSESGYQDVH